MERIKVAIRLRPFLPNENESNTGINMNPDDDKTIMITKSLKTFKGTFDNSARYVLIAKFEFERSDPSDKKTVRCRYNCESYIFDNKTSLQILPFTIKGRESHITYDEAMRKTETALISKIKKDYSKAFYDYIRSL